MGELGGLRVLLLYDLQFPMYWDIFTIYCIWKYSEFPPKKNIYHSAMESSISVAGLWLAISSFGISKIYWKKLQRMIYFFKIPWHYDIYFLGGTIISSSFCLWRCRRASCAPLIYGWSAGRNAWRWGKIRGEGPGASARGPGENSWWFNGI